MLKPISPHEAEWIKGVLGFDVTHPKYLHAQADAKRTEAQRESDAAHHTSGTEQDQHFKTFHQDIEAGVKLDAQAAEEQRKIDKLHGEFSKAAAEGDHFLEFVTIRFKLFDTSEVMAKGTAKLTFSGNNGTKLERSADINSAGELTVHDVFLPAKGNVVMHLQTGDKKSEHTGSGAWHGLEKKKHLFFLAKQDAGEKYQTQVKRTTSDKKDRGSETGRETTVSDGAQVKGHYGQKSAYDVKLGVHGKENAIVEGVDAGLDGSIHGDKDWSVDGSYDHKADKHNTDKRSGTNSHVQTTEVESRYTVTVHKYGWALTMTSD